jgi:hypothetical protein
MVAYTLPNWAWKCVKCDHSSFDDNGDDEEEWVDDDDESGSDDKSTAQIILTHPSNNKERNILYDVYELSERCIYVFFELYNL